MIHFKIRGLKIQIYPSFFFFSMITIALGLSEQFFLLFISVTLHELAHVFAARFYHLKAESIVITPIGQLAVIENLEPQKLYKKIVIFLAGPLTNITIALFLYVFFPNLSFFITSNIYLAVFNLIPIYPLDGGRINLSLLTRKFGVMRSARIICEIGKWFSIALMLLGLFQVMLFPFNCSIFLIGCYLYRTNKKEHINLSLHFYRLLVLNNSKSLLTLSRIKYFAVSENYPIRDLFNLLNWDEFHIYKIISNNGTTRELNELALIKHVCENGMLGNINILIK